MQAYFSKISTTLGILFLMTSLGCNKVNDSKNLSKFSDFQFIFQSVPNYNLDRNASIKFVFVNDIPEYVVSKLSNLNSSLIIKPSLKGQWSIENPKTLIFKPEVMSIDPHEDYFVELNLDELKIPSLSAIQKKFMTKVRFASIAILVDNQVPMASLDDPDKLEHHLTIKTNVALEKEKLLEYLSIKINDEVHSNVLINQVSPKEWEITIKGISYNASNKLNINWRAMPDLTDNWSNFSFAIPSPTKFSITGTKISRTPSKKLTIFLSHVIDKNKDLRGLVRLEGDSTQFRVQNESNRIELFFNEDFEVKGTKLYVDGALNTKSGMTLGSQYVESFNFEELDPQVRFVNSSENNIVPIEDKIAIGIQTMNLTKIDIEIFKIFSNNILYNMHLNPDQSNYQSVKLGKVIHQQTLPIGTIEENTWISSGIELSKIIKPEPGALYEIRITFRPEYTTNACSKNIKWPDIDNSSYSGDPSINSYWVDYWPYDLIQDENYDQSNPCSLNYYTSSNFKKKVILASNLSMQAMLCNDKKKVFVTALNSLIADSYSNVKIELYDAQLQLIGTGITNNKGQLDYSADRPINYVVAHEGDHSAYLSMDEYKSLPVSEFDVEGAKSINGLKSSIICDREVWRPGDTIFSNIFLFNQQVALSENFPITIELINPDGIKVFNEQLLNSVMGQYHIAIPSSANYITGRYALQCKIANQTVQKSVWIETIRPNRIKVQVTMPPLKCANLNNSNLQIQTKYLHDAVAANVHANVECRYEYIEPDFPLLKNYTFKNPEASSKGLNFTAYDNSVDEQGKANFKLEYLQCDQSGFIRLNLISKIQEKSGDISTEGYSAIVKPYDEFVGIRIPQSDYGKKLDKGKPQNISIACVDPSGKPIINRKIKLALYTVNWNWWYEIATTRNNYVNKDYKTEVEHKELMTNNEGIINYQLVLDSYNRFFITATNTANNYVSGDYFYTGWPDDEESSDFENIMRFTSDKEKYKVGEQAKINLPTSKNSLYLINVIKEDKILQSIQLRSDELKSGCSIPLTKEMVPNVYVHVSLIQKAKGADSDLPMRTYGVIPLTVEDESTILNPVINAADKVKPGEKFTIQVSESNNQEMAYQIYIVDEGLLSLSSYKTPNLHRMMFKKEALSIFHFDNFSDVLGDAAVPYSNMFSVGGDMSGAAKELQNQNRRFVPVVINGGLHRLKKSSSNKHEFIINNFVGAVRVMIYANNYKAFGSSEKNITVRSDLMTNLSLPKVINTDDIISVPITIFNYNKTNKEIKVSLESSPNIKIQGDKNKTVLFNGENEKVIFQDVKVDSHEGAAYLITKVNSAQDIASNRIDFLITNSSPYINEVNSYWLEPNQDFTININNDKFDDITTSSIDVSRGLLSNIRGFADKLIHYPYGCVEQVTSATFPQLFLQSIYNLSNSEKQEVQQNINAGIEKLKLYQNSDGSFSYWPGMNSASEWASTYVAQFLIEAKASGVGVPNAMLDSWYKYAKLKSSNYQKEKFSYSSEIQCYRLYILAKLARPDWASMNRMNNDKERSYLASYLLAGAYAISGKKDIASNLILNLGNTVSAYRDSYYTYGSSLRDMLITCIVLNDMDKREDARNLLKKLSTQIKSSQYYTTQEMAFYVLAIKEIFGDYNTKSALNYTYNFGSGDQKINSQKLLESMVVKQSVDKAILHNGSSFPIQISLLQRGRLKKQFQIDENKGLKLKCNWYDSKGNLRNTSTFIQGEQLKLCVEVENDGSMGNLQNIALQVVLPAGFEIRNERFLFGSNNSNITYQDIKDDRVISYFNLSPGAKKMICINANAAYIGSYGRFNVICEAMYDPGAYARKSFEPITIVAK